MMSSENENITRHSDCNEEPTRYGQEQGKEEQMGRKEEKKNRGQMGRWEVRSRSGEAEKRSSREKSAEEKKKQKKGMHHCPRAESLGEKPQGRTKHWRGSVRA